MVRFSAILMIGVALLLGGCSDPGQPPYAVDGEVHFTFYHADADQVYLSGDFANWEPQAIPMETTGEGLWTASVAVPVGFHEYKFVVGDAWIPDPANSARVTNNYGEPNTVFYMNANGEVELRAPETGGDGMIGMPGNEGFLYVSLVWHQHQPYYLDASRDQLVAPWVRTHMTKDYYDMTEMLRAHPDITVTMNLTPVLLEQIDLYVDRLGEFYDADSRTIDADAFLRKYRGRTDPWIDLMLTPTSEFGALEDSLLTKGEWNCFSVSRVLMERWPQYIALKEKDPADYTEQDKRNLKCFFYLANFDPDFFDRDYKIIVSEDGTSQHYTLHDLIKPSDGPPYELARDLTEADAHRIVALFYRVAAALTPLNQHMDLRGSHKRQVEFTTTPYFHPILPLIANVHAGQSGADEAPDSIEFAYPEDARWHVAEAAIDYERRFGHAPSGMWPAEGSVSAQVVDFFADEGVEWIATGDGVLHNSTPEGLTANTPYRVRGPEGGEVAVFFRDTHLSDLIGFRYQRWEPETAAEDLIRQIMARAARAEGDTSHITILLDGENAWEWYEKDHDAKAFLHLMYKKLAEQQDAGRLITVTPHEYLHGNPARGIRPHPVASLPAVDELWPGSWIRADFTTWVGEDEENRGWAWLAKVRADLEHARQNPPPGRMGRMTTHAMALERAQRAMYAAEGSDWFWWYGDDQNTGAGDSMWDRLFRAHLEQVYSNLQSVGYPVRTLHVPALINPESAMPDGGQGGGAMQVGGGDEE